MFPLRDLTAVDIPLLQAVHKEGLAAIERVYGVSKEEIRVFIHYQPQFYLLHGELFACACCATSISMQISFSIKTYCSC